ncbi:hypothetical protein AB1E33_27290 [Ruegeria sp. 2012CJ15-1]
MNRYFGPIFQTLAQVFGRAAFRSSRGASGTIFFARIALASKLASGHPDFQTPVSFVVQIR